VTLTWGPVQDGLFTVEWASALDRPSGRGDSGADINQVGNNYQTPSPRAAPRVLPLARW